MKILSYFENFAFNALTFKGRASPMEYWCVMPVIWVLIIAMIPDDAREFWDFLIRRQVPPLNPLYYESVTLFLLTFMPRLSLTVRRLHDSGKSGKWAKLPFIAVGCICVLAFGFGSALLSANAVGGGAATPLAIAGRHTAFYSGHSSGLWSSIFSLATILNALGSDAIMALLAELQSGSPKLAQDAGVSKLADDILNNPTRTTGMMVFLVIMIVTPALAGFAHLVMMLSPSQLTENHYGPGKRKHKTLLDGPTSANPFAAYKHLNDRCPKQEAQRKSTHKEEIRSIYQSRVLAHKSDV
ncbi:MAG: DUF805 domain-containing protein [Sulfitobacter sp.]